MRSSSRPRNPWAICTAAVGRKDRAKYERCVRKVKAKIKMKNPAVSAVWPKMTPRQRWAAMEFAGIGEERARAYSHEAWIDLPEDVKVALLRGWNMGSYGTTRRRGKGETTRRMPVLTNPTDGWAVTHDGETLKQFGPGTQGANAAYAWLHKKQGQSVDWAIRYSGYNIVNVEGGKVVYSAKHQRKPLTNPAAKPFAVQGSHTYLLTFKGGGWHIYESYDTYHDAMDMATWLMKTGVAGVKGRVQTLVLKPVNERRYTVFYRRTRRVAANGNGPSRVRKNSWLYTVACHDAVAMTMKKHGVPLDEAVKIVDSELMGSDSPVKGWTSKPGFLRECYINVEKAIARRRAEGTWPETKSNVVRRNGNTKGAYPFADKQRQYRSYSMSQLRYALKDAAETARIWRGQDAATENWYKDDVFTISDEIRRREGSAKKNPLFDVRIEREDGLYEITVDAKNRREARRKANWVMHRDGMPGGRIVDVGSVERWPEPYRSRGASGPMETYRRHGRKGVLEYAERARRPTTTLNPQVPVWMRSEEAFFEKFGSTRERLAQALSRLSDEKKQEFHKRVGKTFSEAAVRWALKQGALKNPMYPLKTYYVAKCVSGFHPKRVRWIASDALAYLPLSVVGKVYKIAARTGKAAIREAAKLA